MTLHLNLKKKWFDMIASGEKKEEYRNLTPYWTKRLIEVDYPEEAKNDNKWISEDIVYDLLNNHDFKTVMKAYWAEIKKFETITFSNGFSKNRNQFVIELKGIDVDTGLTEWGAEYNKKYFCLELGKILSKNF
jgi:hypothetical protein